HEALQGTEGAGRRGSPAREGASMKRREPGLGPELEAFLTPREIIRSVPPGIRARALTRAKRIIATGGTLPAAPGSAPSVLEGRAVARARPLVRLGLTVSVAL